MSLLFENNSMAKMFYRSNVEKMKDLGSCERKAQIKSPINEGKEKSDTAILTLKRDSLARGKLVRIKIPLVYQCEGLANLY